jgi:hypothetical protein
MSQQVDERRFVASKPLLAVLVLIVVLATPIFYALKLEPRPEDTTAARVYTEDPHAIDYCSLPELNGSGLLADDIPKAYTPDCEVERWPAPVLAGCTEPLPPEADDLRGLWRVVDGGLVGHVERIEQCGNRVVVANDRFIHDFRTTGTLAEGANDIQPIKCFRIRAAIHWNDEKTLQFRPWNLRTLVTRKLQDKNTMLWKYPGQTLARLERICRLPEPSSSKAD